MELSKKSQTEVSDQNVSEFNIGLLNSHIGDAIDIFLEDMLNKSVSERNFTPGDSQVLSVLNKLRALINQVTTSEELVGILNSALNKIRNINSDYVGPQITQKLSQLLSEVASQAGNADVRISFKHAIRAIFYSEGQLNPRLEVDPSQAMPVGGYPSGETFTSPVVEDKTMEVPSNIQVSDGDKANFQRIYKTLSDLIDLMDNTSHPSTALFARLRRDLGKAENSAWSLLYQLKNQ